jgi:hypothetical protein
MHRVGRFVGLFFGVYFLSTHALAAGASEERTLSLFGKGIVSTPEVKLDESAAAGGVGVAYNGPWTEFTFLVTRGTKGTVGATRNEEGTIQAGAPESYGYTILDPLSSKFNFSLLAGYYRFTFKTDSPTAFRWGPYARIMLSDVMWAYETDDHQLKSVDVTPSNLDFGLGSRFTINTAVQKALITTRLGWGLRRISGNIASDAELRKTLLGTDQRTFTGPIMEVEFRFGAISFGVMASYFIDYREPGSANGLTDIRFIPTISGEAPINFPVQ